MDRNNNNSSEISALAVEAVASLLPHKSRDKYEKIYDIFCSWRTSKNVTDGNEEVMLAFFHEKVSFPEHIYKFSIFIFTFDYRQKD